MAEKFTPGPWRTAGLFGTQVLSDHIEGGGICDCMPTITEAQDDEAAAANARLIATAPELYAALSAMVAAELSDPKPATENMSEAYVQALSALAKAMGGGP